MGRLLPYLFAFAAGFVTAMMLFRSKPGESAGGEWEKKYHEVAQRYRELTHKLKSIDQEAERKANRYLQTLWDVRGLLLHPLGVTPERAASALAEIDTALKESQAV
jgi:hypothetical protein